MGLAISQHLVSIMSGQIEVESVEGKGSIFHFTLPLKESKTKDIPKEPNLDHAELTGTKVPIVDDNITNFRIFRLQLANLSIITYSASSAEESLKILEKIKHIKLIITDMEMPQINGMQLAGQIQKRYRGKSIILLSSIGGRSNAKDSDLFTSVLNKPVKYNPLGTS